MMRRTTPLLDRLLDKVMRDGDCWIFTGTTTRDGYGLIRIDRRQTMKKAHRVSYELHVGPIPVGLEIDHLCRRRSCVNPSHLEPVTHTENVRRSRDLGCRREGHPWTPENTLVEKAGRRCRACREEYRGRRRAAA